MKLSLAYKFIFVSILKKIIYALSSGILLAIAWPSTGSLMPLLFIGLVPLFLLEREVYDLQLSGEKERLFPYVYLSLLTFNIITTWWVYNASPEGGVIAVVLNSLFPALVFQLAHYSRKKLGHFRGDLALIFFWIAWEYFHMDWDLSWTWLTLGNGLASAPSYAQWYEYTGVFGGSLWILLSNLFVVHWLVKSKQHQSAFYKLPGLIFGIKWAFIIALPIAFSHHLFFGYEEIENPIEVVSVQPNIDPYNEKFGGLSSEDQVQKMFDLAEQKVTENTDFVIFPETSIPKPFDEDVFEDTPEYEIITSFCQKHPNTQVIIGASTFVVFGPGEKIPTTARTAEGGVMYDYCNTAISISNSRNPQFYHKSKMVPGVEKIPFPALLMPLQEQIFDLGGTIGTLGGQNERMVFSSPNGVVAGPIICYESIYGEFVGEYVTKGAEVLFVITNDGWWKDTPGYKQHAQYAQLRAIEHRRSIARSANTGISCFINQRGETTQQTGWWVPAVISATINANQEVTFYSEYGDILGRLSLAFGGLLLVLAVSKGLINKK
jgi:apolipoprotein N-acyltransferase